METEKLEQKKRDKKIFITDIAIEKVPLIKYKGFDDRKNRIMQSMAKSLLQVSKTDNNSNEVAFTFDIEMADTTDMVGVSFGEEHGVDVLADTLSYHLINSRKSIAVVLMHNHPSTQTLSLEDIRFFLQYQQIEVIVVISNQGTVHYLMRDNDYDVERAFALFADCTEFLNAGSTTQNYYFAALSFLAKCSEVGLYYR